MIVPQSFYVFPTLPVMFPYSRKKGFPLGMAFSFLPAYDPSFFGLLIRYSPTLSADWPPPPLFAPFDSHMKISLTSLLCFVRPFSPGKSRIRHFRSSTLSLPCRGPSIPFLWLILFTSSPVFLFPNFTHRRLCGGERTMKYLACPCASDLTAHYLPEIGGCPSLV